MYIMDQLMQHIHLSVLRGMHKACSIPYAEAHFGIIIPSTYLMAGVEG